MPSLRPLAHRFVMEIRKDRLYGICGPHEVSVHFPKGTRLNSQAGRQAEQELKDMIYEIQTRNRKEKVA